MKRKNLPVLNISGFRQEASDPAALIPKEILSRWNPEVMASDDDESTITIYQPIGADMFGDGFTARRMAGALRAIGKDKDVVVSINSPGGIYFEGAAIYNLLVEHEGKVTVKIPGLAASAASIIAMAGDEIKISAIGFMMIHNVWGCVCGNKNDMREVADTFEKFDSAAADVYAERSGYDRDKIIEMLNKDTWLNGSEAVEKGFADEKLPAKSVQEKSDDKKAQAFARRSIEQALSSLGYSRKKREEIFTKAFGERDAADPSARDAGYDEDEIKSLIQTIKE